MNPNAEFRRLARKFYPIMIQSLINGGVIDPEGKTGPRIAKESADYVARMKDEDFSFILDHTGSLLRRARMHRKDEDKELACLFYALYIEHELNDFMATLAKRRNLSAKDTESLIRDSSYKAKCSWLLRIFGMRALDMSHTNRIIKLMDLRNSYVHYKWKPENEQITKEMETILKQIEKTIKYLRYFEAKHLAVVPHRRVLKLLKRRA